MYLPQEALGREIITGPSDLMTDEAGSTLYQISGQSYMVARDARRTRLNPDMKPVNEDLAAALFRLAEYGIEFPGIGGLINRAADEDVPEVGHTYTTTHIVEGLNMHHQMKDVPFDVTMKTVDGMLNYYADVSYDFSDRLYLLDLSLRQCMYGRARGEGAIDDGQPHVNFVDFDRRLNNLQGTVLCKPRPYGTGFGGIKGLDNDLAALKENYPEKQFDEVAARLFATAVRLGIGYKVPTAYYHVEDVSQQTHA